MTLVNQPNNPQPLDPHISHNSCSRTRHGLSAGDIRRYLRFSLAMYGHLALKFLRLIPIAGAAVENDLAVVRSVTGGATVLRSEWAGSTYRPGYLLLLDEPGQAVVLVRLKRTLRP